MFTFKKERATGPYASFEKQHTTIKLERKEVGQIIEGPDGWKIRFAVAIPTTERCGFKWIQLKAKPTTEEEARVFLQKNFAVLAARYPFYRFD